MTVDVLIIGGGIIGLACAAESAKRGYSTILIERHESFGQEASSRNSEVIHSGIYYVPGSLKARLCLAGNTTMYAECERLGVWYRRCGKFIVAVTPDEVPDLEKIYQRGIENGVQGLEVLTGEQVKKLEPHIRCSSAIYVPSTGIVDSHELMKAYLHEARSHGADIVFGVRFSEVISAQHGFTLCMQEASGEKVEMQTRFVINAAGLFADKVAQAFGIDIDQAGYRIHPNRGHYCRVSLAKSRFISHLIYPIPHPQLVSVGIHIGIDRAGQCRLGPDAEYMDGSIPETEWYKFDPDESGRREKFYRAGVRYFPSLELEDLSPDQVGIRPKLQGPNDPIRDFVIAEESAHGLPGLVNLIGIESPGLTCACEIAKEVFNKMVRG
ncbi:MAG: NAD(P)/FAD-dependent oxidoreductase [Ignavibacteriae bacterium]|nr:NAD(P)/FAD-dependent oxidoreductase [Ignavibacteriota bacterium]